MASLRKDPRGFSKYWYACITVPGKGQTQRCTKVLATERNRSEATTIAERWEREAKHLGPALYLANRDAIFETFVTATQRAIAGDMTKVDVRDLFNSILESTGQDPIKNETARAFSQRWLKAQVIELAESTDLSYSLAVRLFVGHLGPTADKPLRAVRPEQIETFKTARIATGVSAKTIDRDLKVVRAIFKSAIKQGVLSYDPSQTISLVSRKKKAQAQTVTREVIEPEELDAILNTATEEWRTVTYIGRYTGARLGDCASMRWNNFNLGDDVVDYTDSKTGKRHVIPIHRRLRNHLATLSHLKSLDDYLCPSLAGKPTGGKTGLSKKFLSIMAKAGVDDRRVESKAVHKAEGKRARTLARRSFHAIRHIFISELANAEVAQDVRREMTGHSDNRLDDHHTHRTTRVKRKAINKLR